MTDALASYLNEPVRFAYWVSNLSGGQVVSKIEQRTGWDFDYNVKLARAAEKAGFDFALSATRFVGGDVSNFLDGHLAKGAGELAIALVGLLLAFWLVHFLYKRKIFLRV